MEHKHFPKVHQYDIFLNFSNPLRLKGKNLFSASREIEHKGNSRFLDVKIGKFLVLHFGRIGKVPLSNWEVEFEVLTLCRFWPGSSSDLPLKRVASSIHNGTF